MTHCTMLNIADAKVAELVISVVAQRNQTVPYEVELVIEKIANDVDASADEIRQSFIEQLDASRGNRRAVPLLIELHYLAVTPPNATLNIRASPIWVEALSLLKGTCFCHLGVDADYFGMNIFDRSHRTVGFHTVDARKPIWVE